MEARNTRRSDELEPTLCALLDHVAVELAHEYMRLMEAAAEGATQPKVQGGQR